MVLQNVFGDLANDKTITDLYNVLAYLADRLEFGINTDNGKKLKVNADLSASGALPTVTTVTTVGTVTTMNDQTYIGGLQAKRQVEMVMDTAYNTGFLSNITFV